MSFCISFLYGLSNRNTFFHFKVLICVHMTTKVSCHYLEVADLFISMSNSHCYKQSQFYQKTLYMQRPSCRSYRPGYLAYYIPDF
jgi:hypothetical protein